MLLLDAGHGGQDCGAYYNAMAEKDLNIIYASLVSHCLSKVKLPHDLTRYFDETVSLEDRVKKFNKPIYDMMLSVHCNAFSDDKANGFEVLCSTNHIPAAELFLKHIKIEDLKNRGIKTRDDLYLIRESKKPVIMLELGFISNFSDLKALLTPATQLKLSGQITNCLMELYNYAYKFNGFRNDIL